MYFILIPALTAATAMERAFGVVGPLVGEFLSVENTFKLAWSHFIRTDELARSLTLQLQNNTDTPSINIALADFYFVNQERLDLLLSDFHGDLLSPCIEPDNSACSIFSQISWIMEEYINRWHTTCMFKYLPVILQRDYSKFFEETTINIDTNDTEWRADLQLRPGVEVAAVVKFTDGRVPIGVQILDFPNIFRVAVANSGAAHVPVGAVFIDSLAQCALGTSEKEMHLLPASRTAAMSSGSAILIAAAKASGWRTIGSVTDFSPCHLHLFLEDKINGGFLLGVKAPPFLKMAIFNSKNFQAPLITRIYSPSRFGIYDGHLFRYDRAPLSLAATPPPPAPTPSAQPFAINLYQANHVHIVFSLAVEGDILGLIELGTLDMGYFDIREDMLPLYNSDPERAHVVLLDVTRWKVGFRFREFCASRYHSWWHLFPSLEDIELIFKVSEVCKSHGNLQIIERLFGQLTATGLREILEGYNRIFGFRAKYRIT